MAALYSIVCVLCLFAVRQAGCLEVRDFMPITCVSLFNVLHDFKVYTSGKTITPLETVDFGIEELCANHLAIVTCLAENIYEMRNSENVLVWGSGFLYNTRKAFLLSTRLCSLFSKQKYNFQCLKQAKPKLDRCESRTRDGLQYIRDTMRWDLSVTRKRQTICSVFHPLISCVEGELGALCDVDVTRITVKILQVFLGSDCSKDVVTGTWQSLTGINSNSTAVKKCGLSENSFLTSGKFDLVKHYKSLLPMCKNLEKTMMCLKKTVQNPLTGIDKVMSKTFDLQATEKSLRISCSAKSLIIKNMECLYTLKHYGQFCTDFILGNSLLTSLVSNNFGQDELDVCSTFEDFINCLSTQISRCNVQFAESFRKSKVVTLPKICAHGKHETGPMSGSVLIQCGVPLATEVQGHMGAVGNSFTLAHVLDYLIHFACGEVTNYLTCIKRYLYHSHNGLDEILQDIVNFSDLQIMEEVLKAVCKSSDRINDKMPCFLRNTHEFEQCGTKSLFAMEVNFYNMSILGEDKNRQKLCTDIQTLLNCAVELIARCDPDLGKLANKTRHTLLRNKTHCKHLHTSPQSSALSLLHSYVVFIVNIVGNLFFFFLYENLL